MRKVISGLIGIIVGAAMIVGFITKLGLAQKSGAPAEIDTGSALFAALFVLGGIYYLVIGLKERKSSRRLG